MGSSPVSPAGLWVPWKEGPLVPRPVTEDTLSEKQPEPPVWLESQRGRRPTGRKGKVVINFPNLMKNNLQVQESHQTPSWTKAQAAAPKPIVLNCRKPKCGPRRAAYHSARKRALHVLASFPSGATGARRLWSDVLSC